MGKVLPGFTLLGLEERKQGTWGDSGQQEKLENPDLEGSFDNLYISAQTEEQSGPLTFRRELWPGGGG